MPHYLKKLTPLSEEKEKRSAHFFKELGDLFDISLDFSPSLELGGVNPAEKKLAWQIGGPNASAVAQLAPQLAALKPRKNDTLVLDLLSISAFMGTAGQGRYWARF